MSANKTETADLNQEAEFILKHRVAGAAFLLFFGALFLPWLLGPPSVAGNLAEAIKSALRENRAYDVFVRDIVSAEGDLFKPGNGLVGYKARESMQLDRLSNTVKTFTGVAILCTIGWETAGQKGAALTAFAFESALPGSGAKIIAISIAVLLSRPFWGGAIIPNVPHNMPLVARSLCRLGWSGVQWCLWGR